jgi:hypothetical protein
MPYNLRRLREKKRKEKAKFYKLLSKPMSDNFLWEMIRIFLCYYNSVTHFKSCMVFLSNLWLPSLFTYRFKFLFHPSFYINQLEISLTVIKIFLLIYSFFVGKLSYFTRSLQILIFSILSINKVNFCFCKIKF